MHIEPGVVDATKITLSYVTAIACGGYLAKIGYTALRQSGATSLLARAAMATGAVLSFFQILPHHPVGVSEVHLILGSTLFLLLGAAPAAIGLVLGLLAQGLFFAPHDLPQFGMNVTTLLAPLFVVEAIARRTIAPNTAYVDLTYRQTLVLSTAFQGGVIAWVAFWVLYGQGFGVATLSSLATFGAAYASVIAIEPLVDLAALALAKTVRGIKDTGLVAHRLFHAA